MTELKRIFLTDCEGPISKNDNAFELTCQFIPEGEKFFTQISRYDDILADIVKRDDYKAGDTLKLITPFLKAYGVTNKMINDFSSQSILLMPGAKDTLQFLKGTMPRFIISTSYEHYIRALCRVLRFPFKNTHCTKLDIDCYSLDREELSTIKKFRREICAMPLIESFGGRPMLETFSESDKENVNRLNEIFWEEMMQLEAGRMLREVNPIGGAEKANAGRSIADENEGDLSDMIYVGDSITDVECFRLVKQYGGVTVSFNGNTYAVREAEIAVLSRNTFVVAVIADVFNRLGKESVFDLVENWGNKMLKMQGIDQKLLKKLQTFQKDLPEISKITKDNIQYLIEKSNTLRKLVRGEKIGRLG